MSGRTELWMETAETLQARYAAREVSPVEVLEACLARADAVNPALNALTFVDRDGARAAARASAARWQAGAPLGPLDGIPLTIKDSLHTVGQPAHWGSAVYDGFVPAEDETPVRRLRDAGAVMFGRTNVPEFTVQGYTGNPVHGVARNPWDTALTPGGSSGGAVACVAAGIGPLALGTDAGGSIRRPASHTGLIGLKPGLGRVPRRHGFPPIMLDLEVVGPMARCVADLTAAMSVIAAPDRAGSAPFQYAPFAADPPAARALRILFVPTFADAPVDPEIAASVAAAAGHLEALGHAVEESRAFTLADPINAAWPLFGQVGIAWLMRHRPDHLGRLGADIRAMADAGARATATDYFDLLAMTLQVRSDLAEVFTRHDLVLTPSAAALPWRAEATHPPVIDGQPVGPRGSAIFTGFVNAAGCPAISIPCAPSRTGLPIGFQLIAPWGAEERLLAVASAYEAAHPWAMSWAHPGQMAPSPDRPPAGGRTAL